MKATRTTTTILIGLLGLFATASAQNDKLTMSPDEAKAKQAYAFGVQAYIWGCPSVGRSCAQVHTTTTMNEGSV